jgi:hypothetical protein
VKGKEKMPYTIQGQSAPISTDPQVREGRTYVPLREVAEQLGGRVSWDNSAKRATVTIGQWVASVNLADTNVDVSGTAVTIQAPPFVDGNGEMWVPASFFKDAFGYQVQINGSNIGIVNPLAA